MHLDIRDFYLLTDAQEKCFKKNIKIYIKTAPTVSFQTVQQTYTN